MTVSRRTIDWERTGKVLALLRADNLQLRRRVCHFHNYDKGNCAGDCKECTLDMDLSISRKELADVFNVSESVISNWENAKTPVPAEDLLFYSDLADVDFFDIVIFSP